MSAASAAPPRHQSLRPGSFFGNHFVLAVRIVDHVTYDLVPPVLFPFPFVAALIDPRRVQEEQRIRFPVHRDTLDLLGQRAGHSWPRQHDAGGDRRRAEFVDVVGHPRESLLADGQVLEREPGVAEPAAFGAILGGVGGDVDRSVTLFVG